jgi:hypothetical protein
MQDKFAHYLQHTVQPFGEEMSNPYYAVETVYPVSRHCHECLL